MRSGVPPLTSRQAGVNHKGFGKKLDNSMNVINEQVRLCQMDHEVMQTREIRACIIQLYVEVSQFLNKVMRYLSSSIIRLQ